MRTVTKRQRHFTSGLFFRLPPAQQRVRLVQMRRARFTHALIAGLCEIRVADVVRAEYELGDPLRAPLWPRSA
jgi:hypothetical protein